MVPSDTSLKLTRRLIGGVWRRARHVWRRLTLGDRPPPVEVAWQRLCRWGDEIAAAESTADEAAYQELLGGCIETALSYGAREIAGRWTKRLSAMRQGDGCSLGEGCHGRLARPCSVPGRQGRASRPWHPTVSSAAHIELARQAVLWYQSGHRDQADRAIESLQHRQRHRAPYLWKGLRGKSADAFLAAGWTTKYYLDAALLRVKAAFEDQWASFPEEIDPADGRMRAVRTWFEDLPRDARVADVGCGRGRFLKRLADEFPEARLTGVDVSPAMLRELPAGIEPLEGSLLDIPAADATLDGALAVESLEHALLPERAVAELCRIVRPGGRVLIIDKHVAKQSLSEHDPWERWFSPEELTAWLRPWCDDVTVAPVSHAEGRGGDDLFLAANGRRRA